MDLGLTHKVALVLAASKGLGRASASALAQEGAQVVIGSRDKSRLELTAKELSEQARVPLIAVPVDVTQPHQVEHIINETVKRFGKIDILVNNAGGPPFGAFEGFSDEDWLSAFQLNLLSTARLSRLVLPHMKKTGTGRIINIVSTSVKSYLAGSVLSTSIRMGVVGLAKMLSQELAPWNITVNNIAPGTILTDRITALAKRDMEEKGITETEALDLRSQAIPMGRMGRPEELGALVAFLASAQASYITGTTIPIDGGAVKSIY